MNKDENYAFKLAINYLSYKPRTVYEVKTYLTKKGYENLTINKILEKLSYYKYIDDEQYTEIYISSSIKTRNKSKEMTKLELEKRGISSEIISKYISMFSYDINLEVAKEISYKYFYKNSNLPFKQLKNKLSQLLACKRFSYEIINSCLGFLEQNEKVQLIVNSNKEEYQLQALTLAEKYFLRYSKKEENCYLLQQKIKQALYRRGYNMDIINYAVNNLFDKNDPFI